MGQLPVAKLDEIEILSFDNIIVLTYNISAFSTFYNFSKVLQTFKED